MTKETFSRMEFTDRVNENGIWMFEEEFQNKDTGGILTFKVWW